MNKTKFSAAGFSIAKACVLGSSVNVLLLIVLAMVSAIFISNEYFEMEAGGYLAGISQFLASFIGCLIAGKLVKERKAITCAAAAGGCLLIQLAAAILFFNGISGDFLLCLLPMLAACGCAILLCANRKKHSGSKKRRVYSR